MTSFLTFFFGSIAVFGLMFLCLVVIAYAIIPIAVLMNNHVLQRGK